MIDSGKFFRYIIVIVKVIVIGISLLLLYYYLFAVAIIVADEGHKNILLIKGHGPNKPYL